MVMAGDEQITEDTLLSGRISLKQLAGGHRAGTDAVLLAAATHKVRAGRIVDVGAATGAVGIMLAANRPETELVLIEQDEQLVQLATDNLQANGLSGRGMVVTADIFSQELAGKEILGRLSADLVVSNPPFMEEGKARLSPDMKRRKAHVLPEGGLPRWIAFCAGLVKSGGSLALIHRADRMIDCLAAIPAEFGAFRITAIYPREGQEATRVIIMATRGRKTPAVIEPPVFLHDAGGNFTAEAKALHDGSWF